MQYVVCSVPVAPVRLLPDHRSEMTSQFLFGETARVTEMATGGWLRLESIWDNYPGWCRGNQFTETGDSALIPNELSAAWSANILINGSNAVIPFGSVVSFQNNQALDIHYDSERLNPSAHLYVEEEIRRVSAIYLGTPYLWGGKSVFGIDCSGFVQSVFRTMNIPLLRDANIQVNEGNEIGFLEESRCGDLAFSDDENGDIVHVGILLDEGKIIHSSGNVRIDRIDNSGIIHSFTNKRTHRLRVIRRMIL